MLIQLELVLLPPLLVLSALFAATEAALFSLSRPQLEALRETRPATHRLIRSLLQRPETLLTTIVVGNEVLNIMIGTLVTTLIDGAFPALGTKWLVLFSVVGSAGALLLVSEVPPKIIAFRFPVFVATLFAYPISILEVALRPIRYVFAAVSRGVLRILGVKNVGMSTLSERDLRTLFDAGEESGTLDNEEKQLILNVFKFSDTTVSSILTPWDKVFTVNDDLSPEKLLQRVSGAGFSRVPYISAKDGHVRGILYAKQLLRLLKPRSEAEGAEILGRAVLPPFIVSTHKKVARLFREFKMKKVHFALVVDEYGKYLGVVTLEDVLVSLLRTNKPPKKAAA